MKIFNYTDNLAVVCECKPTRNGFKHVATVLHNGRVVDVEQCFYLNRTWESFEYESVLRKAESYIDNNIKLEHWEPKTRA
jgi:hypothetical protein